MCYLNVRAFGCQRAAMALSVVQGPSLCLAVPHRRDSYLYHHHNRVMSDQHVSWHED